MDQVIRGANQGPLTGGDWVWLNDQNRAIALDYPITLKQRDLAASKGGKKIISYLEESLSSYGELIERMAELREFFSSIKLVEDPAGLEPFWSNGWFPRLDAMSLCMLLYLHRPNRYVEIGSGNSTKFARKLIKTFNLPTKIISVDPHPRADIDLLCDDVVRLPLENVDPAFFETLTRDDIFFIDSSHRSFPNSDVTVFFLEILPALADGMIYGIHDIVLPRDYSKDFLPRFYNEQYLLAAYILGGTQDEPIFPCAYVSYLPKTSARLTAFSEAIGLDNTPPWGAAYWARKNHAVAPKARVKAWTGLIPAYLRSLLQRQRAAI